uniref:Uncharacterized protein n=1 Tax=Nelumbo nucifera TaxID=4432 RepID=A0A822ZAD4_NELNU|nr:TPA_asm: hypothetical protein HUJ06_015856 [Nelumbo nucifera]
MKLLPTGRKNSLAIFLFSSIVGIGSFFISYLLGLVHSLLIEMGFHEDMYNPVRKFFSSLFPKVLCNSIMKQFHAGMYLLYLCFVWPNKSNNCDNTFSL